MEFLRRQSNLTLLILFIVPLLIFRRILYEVFGYDTDAILGNSISFRDLTFILETMVFWFLVGREISHLNTALNTGLIAVSVFLFNSELRHFGWFNADSVNYGIPYILYLIPLIFFSYKTMKSKRSIWMMIGLLLILLETSTVYFGIELSDLLDFFFDLFYFDYPYRFMNAVDSVFSGGISIIISFLTLTHVFKMMEKYGKPRFNLIEVRETHSVGQITLLIFILYSGIFMMSTGINDNITSYSRIAMKDSGVYLVFIKLVFGVILPILNLLLLCWLYRKILVEFYLSHQKKIDWNYFLLQIPIVGIIVWMVNMGSFTKPKSFSESKMNEMLADKSSGIAILLFILTLLNFGRPVEIELSLLFLINLVSVVILGVYILYKYGMAIIITFKIIAFIILLILSGTDFLRIPPNIIGETFFTSIALTYIYYPLFHLNELDIEYEITPVQAEE